MLAQLQDYQQSSEDECQHRPQYALELEDKHLVRTEPTTVVTRDGRKRNGTLLYHIRPIQLALDQFYEQQLTQMDVAAERQRVAKALALRSDKRSSA